MKIGINLQDDRISCEVIHESMNSISYERLSRRDDVGVKRGERREKINKVSLA